MEREIHLDKDRRARDRSRQGVRDNRLGVW